MALKAGFLIVLATLFCGCASPGFNYRYYGLSEMDFTKGFILGPEAKDDLPFDRCAKNGCVVMFAQDFFAMKLDFLDTQNRLTACERN